MRVQFLKFWHNRKGGAAIEYSLLAALFAVGAIVAFQLFGNSLSKTYSEIPSQMDGSDGGENDDNSDDDQGGDDGDSDDRGDDDGEEEDGHDDDD